MNTFAEYKYQYLKLLLTISWIARGIVFRPRLIKTGDTDRIQIERLSDARRNIFKIISKKKDS